MERVITHPPLCFECEGAHYEVIEVAHREVVPRKGCFTVPNVLKLLCPSCGDLGVPPTSTRHIRSFLDKRLSGIFVQHQGLPTPSPVAHHYK